MKAPGEIHALALSADGRTIVTGAINGVIHLWDAATGKQKRCITGNYHQINALAFSPDGRTLAAASDAVRFWDLEGERRRWPTLKSAQGMNDLAFAPDGKALYTSDSDRRLRVWDLTTTEPKSVLLKGQTGTCLGLALSPDGKTLASGNIDSKVYVLDPTGADPVGTFQVGGGKVFRVAYSSDGRFLAAAAVPSNSIHIWDLKERTERVLGRKTHYNSLAFSPNNRYVAANGIDGHLYLWDPATGDQLARRKVGGLALTFSPDSQTVIVASKEAVKLWDVAVLLGPTVETGADKKP